MNTSDVAVIDTPIPNSNLPLPRQQPSLSGSGFSGATVEVWQKNGGLMAQGTVQNTRWTITLADLAPGTNNFTFSVHQILGNVVSEWRDFSFAVADMKTSDVAVIDTPPPGGNLPWQKPLLSGSGFSGATVEIWQKNGGLMYRDTVQNNRWSTPLPDLAPDTNNVTFSVRQVFGGAISEWRDFSFTVSGPPAMTTSDVAVIDTPPPGGNLPRQVPSLSGTGFSGARVEIWQKNGGLMAQGTVQNNRWSIPLADLAPGTNSVTFSVHQVLGNVTSEWQDFSFTVTDVTSMKTSDVAVIDTPVPNTDLPRENASLSGTGFPGAIVELWQQNGGLLAQGAVNQNRRWNLILADDLPLNLYTFSVRQTLGGVTSEWRNFAFNVVKSSFPINAAPQIIAPNGTLSPPFRISGKATPGATVSVYRAGGGIHFGDTTANDNGDWTIENVTQPADTYLITARQTKNTEWSQWAPNRTFVVIAADGLFQFDGTIDPTEERLRIGKRLADSDRQPTGLYLAANTALTLDLTFISRIGNPQATLLVGALDSNPDIRFKDPREYPLNDGRNVVTDPAGGMLYLKLSGVGNRIKVNFISGAVRAPTFIYGQTTLAEYRQALNTYTQSPHVELRAYRLLVTVTREAALLHQDADQNQLMETYSKISNIQDMTIGLDNSTPLHAPPQLSRHLIMGNYTKTGECYAWHGATVYPLYYDKILLNSNDLKKSWGVSHELGHQHQMLCYEAYIFNEVSNNLPALAQERAFGIRSRLLILDGIDHWKVAFENINRPGLNYVTDLGGVEQLCPLEQLRLAFGDDFWPRLNKYARENLPSNGSTPPDPQAFDNLALCASSVANVDLRSFFAAWGIPLTPSGQQRIAALSLPSAPMNLLGQREF
ncbi:M60 family metallopeptidase [Pseudomonas sp. MWU12-2037]|uniref:M60 family metallopeptidase n=1 Tax=Pseudomonas sp. MWU12-2037 TaxID=2928690 RepID=UPI00200E308A|nr:M60 family metallopeptidase [Pseudomonas sp. MWU12-2037]